METIQKYQAVGESEPYQKAIEECIAKGILADYLKRKGSEVTNMLLAEYDYKTDIEVQSEEAYQRGEIAGIKKGREEGKEEGREEGKALYGKLTHCLIRDGRIEELEKAAEDAATRKQLMKEYEII